MKLYLVRHGEAVSGGVNPERPLTQPGRADVERIGIFLGKAGVRVTDILHSGKERARQTAELLATHVGDRACLGKASGIGPFDPTDDLVQALNECTKDTMVVGHLPFMAKLVSRLAAGDEAAITVVFQPGAIVCLEREERDWSIAWIIQPELVSGAGLEKP